MYIKYGAEKETTLEFIRTAPLPKQKKEDQWGLG